VPVLTHLVGELLGANTPIGGAVTMAGVAIALR
jgi:hypothetical protein